MSKLSKTQQNRLGGLLSILQGRTPYESLKTDLVDKGMAYEKDGVLELTPDGQNEKDRLQILAGLMVSDDYMKNRKLKFDDHNKSKPNHD